MMMFIYILLVTIALSALCSAEQNAEFRERAEIYSSNVLTDDLKIA